MSLKKKFEKKFGNKYTRSKCKDKGCTLQDISKKHYFMLNGDKIKKSSDNSVDCIIIDLRKNKDKKYKIILCELSDGTKTLTNAIKKFQGSGKLIINHLDEVDEKVSRINCLLIGRITKNGKVIDKKQLLKKFKIEGYDKSLIIQTAGCGYSITQLES